MSSLVMTQSDSVESDSGSIDQVPSLTSQRSSSPRPPTVSCHHLVVAQEQSPRFSGGLPSPVFPLGGDGISDGTESGKSDHQSLQRISHSLVRSVQHNLPLTQHDEKECREYYLSIINHAELSAQEKKKHFLDGLGQQLATCFNYPPLGDEINVECYRSETQSISPLKTSGLVTIGSLRDNDLQLAHDHVSRFQMLVYFFDTVMAVVDVASLNGSYGRGFTTIDGENRECEYWSREGGRRLMIFDRTKPVILRLARHQDLDTRSRQRQRQDNRIQPHKYPTIIFNPITCVICFDRPREVRFDCGHALSCWSCYQELQESLHNDSGHGIRPAKGVVKCPYCRQLVRPREQNIFCHTFVPSSSRETSHSSYYTGRPGQLPAVTISRDESQYTRRTPSPPTDRTSRSLFENRSFSPPSDRLSSSALRLPGLDKCELK